MGTKDWCHVNKKLLPFKLHFFFLSAGFAGVTPFMPIIAKQLGINATAVGVGYSMIPIFIFFTNPIFGLLVDYFQNIKVFLILLLLSCFISYFSVLFLPPINSEMEDKAYVRVAIYNKSESIINLPMTFQRTCLEELLNRTSIDFKLIFNNNTSCYRNETFLLNFTRFQGEFYITTLLEDPNKSSNIKYWLTFHIEESSFYNTDFIINSSTAFQCIPAIRPCLFDEDNSSVFFTFQFWTFITLAIIGGITSISVATLSSAATFEALGPQIEAYGRQRLFGTISYGLICPMAGILNDISQSDERSFAPGFYLMAAFFLVDIIILCLIQIPKTDYSTNMCSDLRRIFSSVEILSFAFGVALIGFHNALIAMYEFWYLEDMGASKTLLGLTVSMQCLVGEVPFLFFSGWFVKTFGHFLCFSLVLMGFAIRMMLYSIIKNPWFVLPVDILHGVTFGIYHGAMASFADVKSPKGMEATLLGLFGGIYDGLGMGVGSFLGGVGLDNLGPRRLFFSASMLSVGGLVTFLVASYCFRSGTVERKKQMAPLTVEDKFIY